MSEMNLIETVLVVGAFVIGIYGGYKCGVAYRRKRHL